MDPQSIALVANTASDLHRHVVAGRRHALHHLIAAAAGAARQHHAGRDEDVLHLLRVLLQNLHQQLSGLTQALVVHLHQWDRWGEAESQSYQTAASTAQRRHNNTRLKAAVNHKTLTVGG